MSDTQDDIVFFAGQLQTIESLRADVDRLRAAAKNLIECYMADADLDRAITELEDAAGFRQQGAS